MPDAFVQMRGYDLHTHSTISDGILSPEALILRAKAQGIHTISLTDHDNIQGIVQAQVVAQAQSIKLINGVELSTNWKNYEIHIVGLDFDPTHSALIQYLQQQKILRQHRAEQIAIKLEQLGVKNALLGVQSLTTSLLTRRHFSQYLLEQHYVNSHQQAFKRYLGKGKLAYVPPPWRTIQSAIDMIHQIRGKAVLAHPLGYQLSATRIRKLIEEFALSQGDAIEIAGCNVNVQQRIWLADLAEKHHLFSSIGSDFHFPCPWLELGKNLDLPPQCNPIWQHFAEK